MGGVRILSDAQIDEMAELREGGWSCLRIARHFTDAGTPVSQGSIAWQCMRVGADLPLDRRRPAVNTAGPQVVDRDGILVRRFTPDEDARLLDLERDGMALNAIARVMGRKNNSIRGRLMTLARHDARAEA